MSEGEKFPRCARVALLVAIAPILLATLVAVLKPLIFVPSLGCRVVDGLLFSCPGHPLIERIVAMGGELALGSLISTPIAVLLFFACRALAQRKSAARDAQSSAVK